MHREYHSVRSIKQEINTSAAPPKNSEPTCISALNSQIKCWSSSLSCGYTKEAISCYFLFTRFWAFFQIDFLGQAKSPNIWGVFWPVLRNLTEKVGIVQNFGWEFSVNFKPCYVMLIPTLRATLRQLFLGMVKIALYLHGSYFPREHRNTHRAPHFNFYLFEGRIDQGRHESWDLQYKFGLFFLEEHAPHFNFYRLS